MSLVAIVLLVLVVVALGMRSMSRRESSLPPERLKEMAEKEEKTHARSTDEFASHEPRMANFSPDFSPIDAPKQPKPVRTGQRGKRGVDEWGNPVNDEDDEEFWANIRSDAEQGGFGAGGTVAARKAANRPGEPSSERPADRPAARQAENPAERPPQRPARQDRPADRPAERPSDRPGERRAGRKAKPRPVSAGVDPDAATIQAPLPQRPAAAAANLADLVEPSRRTPSQAELAEQRTVTFAAPTPDVMSILGAGAQPVPASRPEPSPAPRSSSRSSRSSRSRAAASPAVAAPSTAAPSAASPAVPGPAVSPAATTSGSYPAISSNSAASGSFPAVTPTSSGSFPIAQPAPIHGAPTSDPFPAAYTGVPADALDTTWSAPAPTASGSWPAGPVADILDDPAPAASYPGPANSWPAFEQPASRSSYPASYEVRPGWAVADDSDPVTGPSPAAGTPTVPNRAVSASASYPDVLSTPTPASPPSAYPAYETGDITTMPASAWPEPPAADGAQAPWPGYGGQPQPAPQAAPGAAPNAADGTTPGGRRRREQDYPHDYYR
ncbi:hypothetical protein [Nonomuraea coxensis]|uniref:hypothetical protein n=1 Tax=Nonomuraea coxensis TaxID=404386 RepID=UPI0012F933D7|nr:hypothetical protein [Nonomuraea coxensis]